MPRMKKPIANKLPNGKKQLIVSVNPAPKANDPMVIHFALDDVRAAIVAVRQRILNVENRTRTFPMRPEQQQAVETLAPSHITVPTGSRIRVEYRAGADAPVVRVRLQECFGLVDTPRIDGVPVLMELLSPGYKPVQLTADLRSFWQDTYFQVRAELRRRYPRHAWPDDPLAADPVRGVRKKKP